MKKDRRLLKRTWQNVFGDVQKTPVAIEKFYGAGKSAFSKHLASLFH